MEEMKMSQEDIEKELDRSLEMFKQLEVEQKAEDIAEQLEKLAEEAKGSQRRIEREQGDNRNCRRSRTP
jgi:hypothetical protein